MDGLVHAGYKNPEGDNLVLAHDVDRIFMEKYGDLKVRFQSLRSFADSLSCADD